MMDRKMRFQYAYDYLSPARVIHSQQEEAERVGTNRPNMSSSYNGNPKVLTDRFLRRFCTAFPQFNLNWLNLLAELT